MTLKNRCSVVGAVLYALAALTLLYCGGHRDCRYGADALFIVSIPSSLLLLPAELLTGWLPTQVGEAIAGLVLVFAPFLNGWMVGRIIGWVWEEMREGSAAKKASIRRSLHLSARRVK